MRRLLPLLALAVAACGVDVEGELRIGNADGDSLRFAPDECSSGQPLEFFGVDMWNDEDHLLRLVHFPADGPELLFFNPGQDAEAFRIAPLDCRQFDGELKRTDTEINGVWAMRGDLALDCDASNGDIVEGQLQFQNCADINNDYSED